MILNRDGKPILNSIPCVVALCTNGDQFRGHITQDEFNQLRPNGRESVDAKLLIPALSPRPQIYPISELITPSGHRFDPVKGWAQIQ